MKYVKVLIAYRFVRICALTEENVLEPTQKLCYQVDADEETDQRTSAIITLLSALEEP